MDEFELAFPDPAEPKKSLDMNASAMRQLVSLIEKYDEALATSGAAKWFVPGTPISIDRCTKHKEFFAAGAKYPERLFMAGNRCGKSVSGAIEASYHATGLYPEWWTGRKFNRPTNGWAAGDTSQTTRDTVQKELLGPPGAIGTGTIPRDRIIKVLSKPGIPNAIESVLVKHVSGGVSTIDFKSYEQGVRAFYGTARHWIWLDEECPEIIYNECLIRTMTTGGIVFVTFTPLHGLTPFIVNFMKNAELLAGARPIVAAGSAEFKDTNFFEFQTAKEIAKAAAGVYDSGRAVVQAGWDDAPWLDEETIARMKQNTPPHLLEARMKGFPSVGAGNVYPVPLEDILIKPFEIPDHWKRMYALDVGWNRTAAIWAAIDPEDDTIYLYSEYYVGEAKPELHAGAIKSRGDIRGVIDPASRGRGQADGKKLIDIYKKLGLKITEAKNERESGIYNTWNRLSNGKLKVFSTLQNFQKEYMIYRRDINGKVIDENDHLMDCMRYVINNINQASQVLRKGLRNKGVNYGGVSYDV